MFRDMSLCLLFLIQKSVTRWWDLCPCTLRHWLVFVQHTNIAFFHQLLYFPFFLYKDFTGDQYRFYSESLRLSDSAYTCTHTHIAIRHIYRLLLMCSSMCVFTAKNHIDVWIPNSLQHVSPQIKHANLMKTHDAGFFKAFINHPCCCIETWNNFI